MHFSLLKLPASFPTQNRAARFNSLEPYQCEVDLHGERRFEDVAEFHSPSPVSTLGVCPAASSAVSISPA